jgi:hypothetical protein
MALSLLMQGSDSTEHTHIATHINHYNTFTGREVVELQMFLLVCTCSF